MSEKGTLCHAMTRWERCEGISRLHGLVCKGGGGRGGAVWRGGESLWCVFEWKYMMYCVSLCKLKFVFPCVHVFTIQGSP